MFEIIPAIDLRNGQCVRLQQGDFNRQTTYDATPVETARRWEKYGATLIHIVDLDGAKSGSSQNLQVIDEMCDAVSCACELGGGIRTPDDVRSALATGVGRVILGTALTDSPPFARELLSEIQADQLVAGLDARDDMILTQGWQSDSPKQLIAYATELFEYGIRNFIFTDIVTDGMFTGPNLDRLGELCDALPEAEIIASGGIGNAGHVSDLVQLDRKNLRGVIVGKALFDGRVTYPELAAASR